MISPTYGQIPLNVAAMADGATYFPLEFEHVLFAVGDPQEPVRVDRPDVAGVEPAVRLQRLRRGLRILVIPAHHTRTLIRISPSSAIFTSVPGIGQPTVPNR